ncbi:MAG: hypothetical protein LH614_03710 [Pyrinomonadaceae bacterium]|nr:hypothetical protein [Pyrinomonadaceae bacterium]
MIIEATTLILVFNQVREWLNRGDIRKERSTENMKNAINSLNLAALETKAYLTSVEKRNEPQNYEMERNLMQLWIKASADLSKIDSDSTQDLSRRCMLKGNYWADPTDWTNEQIHESNIALTTIIEESKNFHKSEN